MHQPTPSYERLQQFIREARAHTLSAKAREHLRWLEHFAETGCSVSITCRYFGIQRMTFYRVLRRCDFTNPMSLEDGRRLPTQINWQFRPQPAQAAPPVVSNILTSAAPGQLADHRCFFCSMKVCHWRYIKRVAIVGSILANLTVLAMVAATVFLESGKAPESMRATILGQPKQQEYTLVPLP